MVFGKLVVGGAIATVMIHHHDKKKAQKAAVTGAQAGQRQMDFDPAISQPQYAAASQSAQPQYRIRNSVGSGKLLFNP